MKTRELTGAVEKNANEVVWYPDYMKARLIDWAKSLDWDWVISRQRLFATPIPVWYCKNCNELILAQENWVPIDPKLEGPRIEKCPKCGGKEFTCENDVFDTWMDSSITCAVHAGWPDRADWHKLFPASVHPSGTDIIRTWAYYLMVRHLALFNETAYHSVLINGMVLGQDGRKMSKSLKNYAAAPRSPKQVRLRRNSPMGSRRRRHRIRYSISRSRRGIRKTVLGKTVERLRLHRQTFS